MVSLPETGTELKAIVGQLDKILLDQVLEWARKAHKNVQMEIDKTLAEHRAAGLHIEHRRDV